MAIERKAPGVVLLVVAVGLAVVGVLFHYAFTAEYGDITASGSVAPGARSSRALARSCWPWW